MCSEHPNIPNEYYDKTMNKAHCATCAMELAQGLKEGQVTGLL